MNRFKKKLKKFFHTVLPFLWFLFACCVLLIFIYLYQKETGFNPVSFVLKSVTKIDAQDLVNHSDLEGKLVAITGNAYSKEPIESIYLPSNQFIVLEITKEHYKRHGRGGHGWRFDKRDRYTAKQAQIDGFIFYPETIKSLFYYPIDYKYYFDKNHRLSFKGIYSNTQVTILAQLTGALLTPFYVQNELDGPWIANFLFGNLYAQPRLFYLSSGSFDKLIEGLRQEYNNNRTNAQLIALLLLFFLFFIPYSIYFKFKWPSYANDGDKYEKSIRNLVWFLGLALLSLMALLIFFGIIKLVLMQGFN
jgi:hypothetical protein